jgi:hypothetical protein
VRNFAILGKRVGFLNLVTIMAGLDKIFIDGPLLDSGEKPLPYPRLLFGAQRVLAFSPSVKITHDVDFFRVGSPYRKVSPGNSIHHNSMGSHFFIKTEMISFIKKMKVIIGQKGKRFGLFTLTFSEKCRCASSHDCRAFPP